MRYRIKELREKQGLSQEALSEKAKVSRTILSRLETGQSDRPTMSTLIKIADALGEEVTDIFLA